MEEINKAYATFRERDRIASLGGGVEKIEKQHESGKMTARERIEMLLDKGTRTRFRETVSYPATERLTVARYSFTPMTSPFTAVHCPLPTRKRL